MPTLEHNAVVEMFRENPLLAPHLLTAIFGIIIPRHVSARVADTALDQLVPVEFRADLVLDLRDERARAVFAIVVEVQRDLDPRKRFTWPAYVAVARAERECPTALLVVAIDATTAAWAGERIDLGLNLGSVMPLVLGPTTVPVVMDPVEAEREVELSVLSAMIHGNGPQGLVVVQTALVALGRLDREHAVVYFQVIWNVLREPMQRALEAMAMDGQTEGKTTFPPFAQRIFERGLDEGKLDGLREALLRLLTRAGISLSEEQRSRIDACADPSVLDRWIENVLGAKAASDVLV